MVSARQNRQDAKDINAILIRKGYDAVPIYQNASGDLLITVKVNDIPGLFILDTGAGGSVIDLKQVRRLKVKIQKDSTTFTGAGAGGQGLKVMQSKGNKIEIGNHVVPDFTLSVMSFKHISQALAESGAHEEFAGVIGVDLLKPGKAIIDYSSMKLYLLFSK